MEFIDSLIKAIGSDAVLTGDAIPARHSCDWSGLPPVRPFALVSPLTIDEVVATLRLCHAHGVPVVPQGGLTGLAGAAVPRADAIALSMHRMNAIEHIDTASSTMTVQAGATLQAVHEAAASGRACEGHRADRLARLCECSDLAAPAANAIHRQPRRVRIDVGGFLFSSRDLALGVPRPFDNTHRYYALIELTGHEERTLAADLNAALEGTMESGIVSDAVVAQSLAQARSLWDIRGVTAEFPTRLQPINFDISLPIGRIGEFCERCNKALSKRWPQHRTLRFGHIGDSNLHLTTDARSIPDLRFEQATEEVERVVYALVDAYGGSISAEHGIGLLKKPFLGASRSESEIEAMRAIKRALDPKNLLNPGKIFDLA